MSPRLPSTFLQIPKRLKDKFTSAARNAHEDINAHLNLMAVLKWDDVKSKYPITAQALEDRFEKGAICVRKNIFALMVGAEFANPYAKTLAAIPLIGFGAFTPFPGDITLGLMFLSSTGRQLKRGLIQAKEEIDGTIEQRQFKDFVNCMTDESDPSKRLILDASPS